MDGISCRLHTESAAAASKLLDVAFARLASELSGQQEDVRLAAARALKALARACLPSASSEARAAALAALEGSLGPAYEDCWPLSLSGEHPYFTLLTRMHPFVLICTGFGQGAL